MNVLATTIPGLFCLAVGVLSILAMRKLLPVREAPKETYEDTTEYTVEMLVPSTNKYIGETLCYAGLMQVNGGKLIKMNHFNGVSVPLNKMSLSWAATGSCLQARLRIIMELTKTHGLIPGDEVIDVGVKTIVSALIMLAMIVLSAVGVLSLLACACLAAIAMVITRCCTPILAANILITCLIYPLTTLG